MSAGGAIWAWIGLAGSTFFTFIAYMLLMLVG